VNRLSGPSHGSEKEDKEREQVVLPPSSRTSTATSTFHETLRFWEEQQGGGVYGVRDNDEDRRSGSPPCVSEPEKPTTTTTAAAGAHAPGHTAKHTIHAHAVGRGSSSENGPKTKECAGGVVRKNNMGGERGQAVDALQRLEPVMSPAIPIHAEEDLIPNLPLNMSWYSDITWDEEGATYFHSVEDSPPASPRAECEDFHSVEDSPLTSPRAECEDAEEIQLTMENAAGAHDQPAYDENGWTPLMHASANGQEHRVSALLEAGEDPNDKMRRHADGDIIGGSALLLASAEGHEQVVRLLLDHGAHPGEAYDSHDGATCLHYAAAHGHVAIATSLLSCPGPGGGAAPDAVKRGGITALMLAASTSRNNSENSRELIRCLLRHGARVDMPDAHGSTALLFSAFHGNTRVAKELLLHHANVNHSNTRGFTPIMVAAQAGCTAMVRLCLKHGAPAHGTRSPNGFTVLMSAAQQGHSDVAALLVKHAADVNAREGEEGNTALMYAARRGHGQIVRLLLDAGGNPNLANRVCRATALTGAAAKGHTDVISALLAHGADPNWSTRSGWTPVMIAARHGARVCVKMLLDKGADPTLTRTVAPHEKSALSIAEQHGHKDVVTTLRSWAAVRDIQRREDKSSA